MNKSAEHLHTWLRRQKKTQRKFAEEIGISYQHMSRLLRGRARPRLPLAIVIAKKTDGFVDVCEWLDADADITA
jgi:transcriptional regulator with XRE-family HTH domain